MEREGSDVTIIAFSIMMNLAMEAADQLSETASKQRWLTYERCSPLDTETIVNLSERPIAWLAWRRVGQSRVSAPRLQLYDGKSIRLSRRTGDGGMRRRRAHALCPQFEAASLPTTEQGLRRLTV